MGNIQTPYIDIRFGSINLTWRYDENRPDYFTSLSHKRLKEKASQMTIQITYVPQPGEDPNLIEYEILNSGGMCIVQYGDLTRGVSRAYRARVMDYSVQCEEGHLGYTFTLMTAAVSYNFVSFTPKPSKLKGKNATLEKFVEVLKSAAKLTEDYYIFKDPTDVLSTAKTFAELEFVDKDISPIKFIIRALSLLVSQKENHYYVLEIDDNVIYQNGDKGVLRVVEVGVESVQVSHTFEWGTKDGTVLSWVPNFKGSKGLIASRDLETINKDDCLKTYSLVDPRTGKIATAIQGRQVQSGESEISQLTEIGWNSAGDTLFKTKLVTDINKFREVAGYVYEGTLTVLGESSPVRLGSTVVSINPLIRGQSHHSAGYYTVIGCNDEVSGSGFTTTYTVSRWYSDSEAGNYQDPESREDCVWVNNTFIPIDQFSSESYDQQ